MPQPLAFPCLAVNAKEKHANPDPDPFGSKTHHGQGGTRPARRTCLAKWDFVVPVLICRAALVRRDGAGCRSDVL